MPWDDDERRGQENWDDYFLGPGREAAEAPVTPGGGPIADPGYVLPDQVSGDIRPGDFGYGGTGGGFGSPSGFTGARTLNFDFGPVPRFAGPKFNAPTAESVLNEPGYKFGMDEGERALQQSAAGRGVLRTGGTLKDINAWGQNYAGQKYGDAFNRALSSYDREYTGALDSYKPLLTEWQTKAAGTQRARELEFQRQWDEYTFGIDDQFRREYGDKNLIFGYNPF